MRLTSFGRFTRIDLAIVGFAVPAAVMAVGLTMAHERPAALIVLPLIALSVVLRRQPTGCAAVMVAASLALRVAYLGIGYSTQVDNARNAAARAAAGMSPYGAGIFTPGAPAEPFVYGPLALVWWQPGVIVELAAAVAVMVILVACRSWLTLALYAGLPFAVYLTTTGVNDYSPGFLILAAMLLLRSHALLGAGVLALASSVKPYAFAWFAPAIGFAGMNAAAVLVGATALLWSPLLIWGPGSFVQSARLHADLHRVQENAINAPLLRLIAVPLSIAGLFVRRWDHMVLLGSIVFCAYLFFNRWASLGYWVAVIPVAGVALESRWWSTPITPKPT